MKHSNIPVVPLLLSALLLGACGGGNEKNATAKDSTASTTPAATSPAASTNPDDDKAINLIASSDCTTCHRLHAAATGASIGPAYDQVAAKYTNAADSTVTRLISKIVSGGSGVWGATPMTPHPSLSKDDVKTMITYILSLKQ